MANFKFVKSATAAVLGASVLTTAVVVPGADASAKTTYKVNQYGYLVNAKTSKKVNGYKRYKGKLYKNGKKFTGKTSYGTYYVKGKRFTGKTKYGYYYVNGKRFTGTTKYGYYYVNGKRFNGKTKYGNLYVNGKRYTGTTKYGYTYYNGKRVEGEYKGKVYANGKKYTGVYKDKLYKNGVLNVGLYLHNGKLYEDAGLNEGKDLYKEVLYDGATPNKGLALYEGKLYNDSALATGYVTFDEKLYNDGALFTGEKDGVEYKDGVVVKYEVTSVKAINASELQVTFSQDVDIETATNAANYQLKVNDENSYRTISSIVVDGKTATLRLDPTVANNTFQSGDKYVIQTNNDIKTSTGKKLEKYVSDEIAFDQSAAPTLVKTAKYGSNLSLTFDRPVVSSGSTNVTLVKIDGVALAAKDLVPSYTNDTVAGEYTYTVAIDANALETAKTVGKHEVVLYDVKDTAKAYAKTASVLTGTYEVTNAVTTPEVTGVEAVNANRLFVYTNIPVTLGTDAKVVVSKGNYEFKQESTKYENAIAAKSNEVDAYPGTLNNKPGVWVTISDAASTVENPLYKGTETSATLNVTLENFTADGLIGKKATQTVTLNKNNTKPSIDAAKNTVDTTAGTLKVVFNNNLGQLATPTSPLTALDASDIVVRDKDGVIVSSTGATVSGNVVTINGLEKVTDAPYTVEFKKETFRNLEVNNVVSTYLVNSLKNDELTTTVGSNTANFQYSAFAFAASDATSDTNVTASNAAAGTYHVDTTKSTITFKYAKEMDDSARQVANYTLDGKALPTGSKVDFVGDKTVVRITLPEGALSQSTQYKLGIKTDVTTKEGSKIVASLQTKAPVEKVITLADTVKPELASAIYYSGVETVEPGTKTNRLEVTFNEKLATALTDTNDAGNAAALASAKDDFKVVVNGSEVKVQSVQTVTSGENKDRKLLLVLNQDVNLAQAATVSIVEDDTNDNASMAVKDLAGNKAKAGSSTVASNYKYNGGYAGALADQAAATTVQNQIAALTNASSQTDVEAARTAYTALTAAQKSLVTNEAALQTQEQRLVDAEAAKIVASAISSLTTGDNVLTQAQSAVTSGFNVTLTTSANSAIAASGEVTQPVSPNPAVTGDVTFTVSKYGKTKTAVVSLTVNP